MIVGIHTVISSSNPAADTAFLRDVLKLAHTDDGGYVIFGGAPAEISVHRSERNDHHQLFLMCRDVKAFVAQMQKKSIACGPVQDQRWGILTEVTLPGGGKLAVYQPRHKRPGTTAKKSAKKTRR